MEKNQNGYNRRSLPESALPRTTVAQDGSVQLAMVYVPYQSFTNLYTPEQAMMHGTLFEELYKPVEVGGHPV